MICDDVKRVAYFFLDGSMGEKKQTDFKSHVSLCPECEQRVSIHRRLRNFIVRRLGRAVAPPTLRQRLTRSFRAHPHHGGRLVGMSENGAEQTRARSFRSF